MEYIEGKNKFIKTWGELGINWGINKTMGQIHGLLLIETEPLNSDQIMEELSISRGNANMNLQSLLKWGLVHKIAIEGERKDFYIAEKDILSVFKQIIKQRKEKELMPMLQLLEDVSGMSNNDQKSAEFLKIMQDLSMFSNRADKALDNLVNSKSNFLINSYLKMIG